MKAIIKYLIESALNILKNSHRILSLAKFEYDLAIKEMFFGKLWKVISPLIQIGTYWLVFGLGIRNGKPIDGYPYVVWLTCGVTPWYIMNKAISTGATSVYRKANMLTKSNTPTYFMPISSVLAVVMDGIWTIVLMVIIYFGNGCTFSCYMFNVLYFIVFLTCFLIALSELTSVLVMLARDFQKIIEMILRLLFFLSPIMWRPGNNMPYAYKVFDYLNPIAYVIRGFRNSILYKQYFFTNIKQMSIMWSITIILYLIGMLFQKKLKNNLLDCL